MRPTSKILDDLDTRDLLEPAQRIASEHHVSVETLCSRRRDSDIVAARHALWRFLHGEGFAYAAIGRIFGCDHTTVRSACLKLASAPALATHVTSLAEAAQ